MPSATASSTMPAPARIVSRACASGVSPSASAAAMPAWAQTLEPPLPNRPADTTVTFIGASLSAVKRPARPAPTITTPPCAWKASLAVAALMLLSISRTFRVLVIEVDHALDGGAGARRDERIDGHFLLEED